MSEENQEAEEGNFFSNISDMLDALVPPSHIEITDIHGNQHRLSGAVPARRQIKVFREFQAIWNNKDIGSIVSEVEEITIPVITEVVMGVAFNEEVLNSLGRAFQEAHPGVTSEDPLDLFAVEEVVAALVPLLMRFVKRVGKSLIGIGDLGQK